MNPLAQSSESGILILGASPRAAAESAVRAGFSVWAAGLFADEDLKSSVVKWDVFQRYREIPDRIADWPILPWFGTGAIENHPALIERLSQTRPHWGNDAEVVRQVRCPRLLAEEIREASFPALEIWPDGSFPPLDGQWMLKPIPSAGGQGVIVWNAVNAGVPEVKALRNNPYVFQQRSFGEPASAVFLSDNNQTVLGGVSRLILRNTSVSPFGFGGVIGPIEIPNFLEQHIAKLGGRLARRFGLRGLWGMDFLIDEETIWVTEINPRYTASVELYEQAFCEPLLPFHCRVFSEGRLGSVPQRKKIGCVGKVVVYAEREFCVPAWEDWPYFRDDFLSSLSSLSDRPKAGSRIPAGHPICSILAAGKTESACRANLNRRLSKLQTHFQTSDAGFSIPRISEGAF